jgi:methyl-accepting chemotaxis protein
MSIFRRLLGIVVILTALFGVALSVGCTIYGQKAVETAADQLTNVIDLAQQNISTTNTALKLAQVTIGDVNNTLDTVEGTAAGLSKSVNDIDPLLVQIKEITTERIPESLQAVEETLPNIAEVAGTVDDTLTTLSNFGFSQNFPLLGSIDFTLGIDYDPETRFDESIKTMGASLEGLPEQLRDLQPELETTQANLEQISGDIENLASDLVAINENLAELPPLLDEYIDSLDSVDSQLDDANNLINGQLEMVKQGVLIVSIWFGLIQLAPLFIGWQMVISSSERALKKDIMDEVREEIEEELEQAGLVTGDDNSLDDQDTAKPFDSNATIVDDPPTKG